MRNGVLVCWCVGVLVWLVGCVGNVAVEETAVPPTTAPLATLPSTIAPTNLPTIQPTNLPTIEPIIQPTVAPTETAVPPKQVALPPTLAEQLDLDLPDWDLIITEESDDLFARGEVDAAFNYAGEGELIWQDPIIVAAAWTDPREEIDFGTAQAIWISGHESLVVMPWREMPPTMKALRIDELAPDDPNYPLQTRLFLRHSGIDTQSLREAVLAQLPRDQSVHLATVGDIMLDRALGAAIQRGEVDFPFAEVADHLRRADLTIGNVESALGSGGVPVSKSYPFIAPPEAAVSLANAGFDIVSLANNHGMDYGAETLLEGIGLLQAQGIATIGAGANDAMAHQPHVVTRNEMTLAFLAYVHVPVEYRGFDTAVWTATANSPGLAWGDPERIATDVAAVAPTVDHVIVVLHSGYEYVPAPSTPQVAASKAAIDAGATLVIGHHAHILQGVEFYNGGVIAYGLGNFAFEIDGSPQTAVLDIWLDKDGVRELRFAPAIVQFGGQPRFATLPEALEILKSIYQQTKILNQN